MEFGSETNSERELEIASEETEQITTQYRVKSEKENREPDRMPPQTSAESETVLEEAEEIATANGVDFEAAPAEVATMATATNSAKGALETGPGHYFICLMRCKSIQLSNTFETYVDEGRGSLRLLYDSRLEHPTIFFPYPKKLGIIREETDITKSQKGAANPADS